MIIYLFSAVLALILSILLKKSLKTRIVPNSIGIFHLYCSSGGGGERVLWHLVKVLTTNYPSKSINIFVCKDEIRDRRAIFHNISKNFNINLSKTEHINFIELRTTFLLQNFPFLTLAIQMLGSMLVGLEAAYRFVPEIYIESIGFSFTLPVFRLHGCQTITYVHYPTISNDMIENVKTSSHASFNNREIFTKSSILRRSKLIYYQILASLYGLCGRQANIVLVNSSWTKRHIDTLWKINSIVVYPPCDIVAFRSLNLDRFTDHPQSPLNIISIAQFRPEKNHHLQIEAFRDFLSKTEKRDSQLTMYGSCRNNEDHKRVRELRNLIKDYDMESNIQIKVGANFSSLIEGMRQANVALHTMKNEHFGIVLLECMAAGLIMISHNSGGPKDDIINDKENGFLANDLYDFSSVLVNVYNMSLSDKQSIRKSAVIRSEKFSSLTFDRNISDVMNVNTR